MRAEVVSLEGVGREWGGEVRGAAPDAVWIAVSSLTADPDQALPTERDCWIPVGTRLFCEFGLLGKEDASTIYLDPAVGLDEKEEPC